MNYCLGKYSLAVICTQFPNSLNKGLRQGYLQGQTAEHVVYIITAYWKQVRFSIKIAKCNLEDPQLRLWSLPVTCVLLHQLREKWGKERQS